MDEQRKPFSQYRPTGATIRTATEPWTPIERVAFRFRSARNRLVRVAFVLPNGSQIEIEMQRSQVPVLAEWLQDNSINPVPGDLTDAALKRIQARA